MDTNFPSPVKPTSRLQRAAQAGRRNRETVLAVLLPVLFALGLGLGWLLWGADSPSNEQANQPAPTAPVRRVEVEVGDSPTLGQANAPVTIIEFSDYECPYCARWHQQVYKRLMKEYEGKIRFVYRDFPLDNIHPNARPAAMSAHCAGAQDAYFTFHDALFSYQYGLGREAYLKYAAELGLDVQAFEACLNEQPFADKVEANLRYGLSIGVSSTPTFFINGIAVVGAQPYEVFQQLIEKELAGQ